MKRHKALRGMKDIMPPDVEEWQRVEGVARSILHSFRYREVRTPILEETGLFVSTIGEDTDIVKKEMFSFKDRGARDITLRPEGTAPVIRAYLEANLHMHDAFQKLYYMGSMFRAERPQAGRSRQFYQIGVEAIASREPSLDAEVIALLAKIVDSIGIKGYQIRLNNLGCGKDKKHLSQILRELFSEKKALLCEDCKLRLTENPLRMLDCKKESCKSAIRKPFKSVEFLCRGCVEHFDEVKKYLAALGIAYIIDPYIVRGLDYYNRTVFEVTHNRLGSQNAIGAGGRYDNLVSDLGGPELGACGFALGFERMLMALGKRFEESEHPPGLDLYVATLGRNANIKAFQILNELRDEGMCCDMDYEGKSLKAKMRTADRLGAKFVAIIGDDELKRNEAILRDMATKEQINANLDSIPKELKARLSLAV